MKIRSPGKLILSGEYAIVHGHPAIAMAVDRYVELDITSQSSNGVTFDLSHFNNTYYLTFAELNALRLTIQQRYQLFSEGKLAIKDVLNHPVELMQFALSLLLEEQEASAEGMKIKLQSSIPMGCGMGSSAAVIISVLLGATYYLQYNMTAEHWYLLAQEAENIQHGRSSGIDLQTILSGGCIYRHGDRIEKRTVPQFPMFLIDTGKPCVSTGECVAKTASFFKTSHIGDDFAAVTHRLDAMLHTCSTTGIKEAIRANHQLLNTIGAVPEKVCHFIQEIEAHDGAAKICGAGAVSGEKAGMVLVILDDESLLKKINMSFGYSILPIQCVSEGVHVI